MEENGSRAEAIRLLGIAEKLLQNRDFNGSRDFAILAQETEPLLDGSDQILAVVEVLLAADKRINNHHDWYSILQIDRRSEDNDLIKKQYRRLALLLHPDKNKFSFADHAFKLVADAWAVLSDSSKKYLYDKELGLFTRIDLSSAGDSSNQAGKLAVTRRGKNQESVQYCTPNWKTQNENQSCERAFHAVLIPTLPPLVPGKEAYYCCWAFFPLGFVFGSQEGGGKPPTAFPNWMPPMFPGGQQGSERNGGSVPAPPPPAAAASTTPAAAPTTATNKVVASRNNVAGVSRGNVSDFAPRKRGRPRKNPL
ncbi:dnaJ homolog subfamily C member 14-like isoform X2 [Durio zibethinus]|uniref:DnaJ homolog subfamily C member 14-like isoform X2 n=1 Tax=Durio zibethinus TaxID=66656 RepID=A0A6P5XWA7_DURZI|nr:dnaJ homolog subfamily C member 14-like isoform X2 [Durio zibethinus]